MASWCDAERCAYCGVRFGALVKRPGRCAYPAERTRDHFRPVAEGRETGGYVAACRDCNSIKRDMLFASVDEASRYLRDRRRAKGYAVLAEDG